MESKATVPACEHLAMHLIELGTSTNIINWSDQGEWQHLGMDSLLFIYL